ncbi:MAG: gliding motility-associated C-terminal domain-containing protein [Saprospiraceae bacterium]
MFHLTLIVWSHGGSSNIPNGASATFSPSFSETSVVDSIEVSVITDCDNLSAWIYISRITAKIPNIFSPNKDGRNDVFRPFFPAEMDVVEVYVFNRWGQKVFESTDTANGGWDGKVNGKDAPADVYIYRIRYGQGNTQTEVSGEVTLVR